MASPPAPPQNLTTHDLHRDHLAQRAAVLDFDPREIRLSEVGLCGRRQTLRILGFAEEPPTLQQQSIFRAGHHWEDYIAGLWEARFPGQVQRQIEVPSPFGTGHIDIWVDALSRIVEAKSTTSKQRPSLPLAHHCDQVQLYLHFYGHARGASGEITYVIKETGELLSFPVVYDSDRVRTLLTRLMNVALSVDTGEPLPVPPAYHAHHFPCSWPVDTGYARCGFWEHCWGHAEPTTPDHLYLPQLREPLEEYTQLTRQIERWDRIQTPVRDRLKTLKAFFDHVLSAASAAIVTDGEHWLRGTPVKGRKSFDVDAARRARALSPDVVRAFTNEGKPSRRWSLLKSRP